MGGSRAELAGKYGIHPPIGRQPVYCHRDPFQRKLFAPYAFYPSFPGTAGARQGLIFGQPRARTIEEVVHHIAITLESPPPGPYIGWSSVRRRVCCAPSSIEGAPIVGSRVGLIDHVPFEFSMSLLIYHISCAPSLHRCLYLSLKASSFHPPAMLLQNITNTHRHIPSTTVPKRRFVKAKTTKARQPKTTAHSLPNEVLIEIFIAATFVSEESQLEVPDILSHVSSRWRAIVLDTSILWTFVVVTFPFSTRQIARAKTALVRSKNRPIDVYVDVRDPEWTWELDEDQHAVGSFDMVEIMEWLGSSHPRWRSLSVFTDNWEPMQTFLAYSTMFTSLSSLETLSLNRCNAYAGLPGTAPDSITPIELFGGNARLPKLRHVVLSGVYIDYSCTGFKDLLSLDLRHQSHGVSPSPQELHKILRASPELNSLSLVALSPSCSHGFEEPWDAPIIMSRLKELSLGWWNVEDSVELLGVLRIPAVEKLSLEDMGSSLLGTLEDPTFDDFPTHDSTRILDVLAEMSGIHHNPASLPPPPVASRSSSPRRPDETSGFPSCLRTLTINNAHLDPTTFSEFLPRLTHLEELELKSVDSMLIGALRTVIQPPINDHYTTASGSGLGPTLRTLRLWLSSGKFREAARALYDLKLQHPGLRIVNMVNMVSP